MFTQHIQKLGVCFLLIVRYIAVYNHKFLCFMRVSPPQAISLPFDRPFWTPERSFVLLVTQGRFNYEFKKLPLPKSW
jgi:hypothetical protein